MQYRRIYFLYTSHVLPRYMLLQYCLYCCHLILVTTLSRGSRVERRWGGEEEPLVKSVENLVQCLSRFRIWTSLVIMKGGLCQKCHSIRSVVLSSLCPISFIHSPYRVIHYVGYTHREPNCDACDGLLYVLYSALFKLAMRDNLELETPAVFCATWMGATLRLNPSATSISQERLRAFEKWREQRLLLHLASNALYIAFEQRWRVADQSNNQKNHENNKNGEQRCHEIKVNDAGSCCSSTVMLYSSYSTLYSYLLN